MKSKTSPDRPKAAMPSRVLIVEDDAVLALSLEAALLDHGVETIEVCSTTEAALAALKRNRPNAIVLDVHLADRGDGWAIAELVRTLGPKGPQIVFSTGAPQDIPKDVSELGCILEKPYEPAVLAEILKEPKRRGIISRLRGALN